MVARKRKVGENYIAYRANLEAEARALRQRLHGSYFWNSDMRGTFKRSANFKAKK